MSDSHYLNYFAGKKITMIITIIFMLFLQVIALVCGILSLILLIIAIATTSWLETEGYRQGLWEECASEDLGDENAEFICEKNEPTGMWPRRKRLCLK